MCSNSQTVRLLVALKLFYTKYSLSHFTLLCSYIAYILASGYLFYLAESVNSQKFRKSWQQQIARERNAFIRREILPEIFNNTKLFLYIHDQKSQYLAQVLNSRLTSYETVVKLRPPMPQLTCDLTSSIIFAFSTITTIGYGYIYPVTERGKILSIVMSTIGIPFTMIIIKDLSYLLAKMMNLPCLVLEKLWAMFRFCTIRPVDEYELERKLHNGKRNTDDYRLHDTERLLSIPVTIAIFSIFGWITMGCLLLRFTVPNLTYSTAFYFIFNSLTTIGTADIEPQNNPMVLACMFLYLLIGLTLVSLFINLLHTKLSRAYWLPGRMYAPIQQSCRGPLASVDSFQEATMDDYPFNHFTTLGILHTDVDFTPYSPSIPNFQDKRELLAVSRKDHAAVEAQTQTMETQKHDFRRTPSPSPVRLPYPTRKSPENVSDLIIETYGKPLAVYGPK